MKTLVFSYGTLILQENLNRFKSKLLKSVFIDGFELEVVKAPITKELTKEDIDKYGNNYHFIQLIRGNGKIPGFLIETEDIKSIDNWEGKSYIRTEIECYTRNLEKIKCFIYLKN